MRKDIKKVKAETKNKYMYQKQKAYSQGFYT
jgi:hypothetical protein